MLRILKSLYPIVLVPKNVRRAFSGKVSRRLVDAGWHKGRTWDAIRFENYLSGFDMVFPPSALRILSDYGGLNVSSGGRMICFGEFVEGPYPSHEFLRALIGKPLFPIGWTNIFEDDGLCVLVDESGAIYVDGATGYNPPRDYRTDLIETNIELFLRSLFSGKRIPEKQSWYYSQADFE